MKVAELLESRRENWRQLDQLCHDMRGRRKRKADARVMARFAGLYRAVCADLALADAYQLPPGTVAYLHQLVGRAHNQLYRSRMFNFRMWTRELFVHVPRRLYRDNALRLSFVVFWGIFITSMFLASGASPVPGFAEALIGDETITSMEQMYADPIGKNGKASGGEGFMTGFYVMHNTGIGLRCFAAGLIFGVGGLFALVFNAAFLGAVFGYMSRVPAADNFYTFVTAHGPFELTAVVLSAAAGMRLGFALVDTGGLSRGASLRRAAREAMPTMGAAMVLFLFAALIEGFISPSALPYAIKAAVSVLSCGLLLFYFVLLGYPPPEERTSDEIEPLRSPFDDEPRASAGEAIADATR